MVRNRRWPAPATVPAPAEASNVVELRPGFVLRAPIEKVPSESTKPLLKGVTAAPGLLKGATKKAGRNISKNNGLLMSPGLIEVRENEGLSPLGENPPPSAKDPTFQRQVARLSAMKLRTVYHLEATAHRNMLGREKGGAYTVAAEFRDFRRFLTQVGPCPAEGWTLDRKDFRNPVYGPGLVRWASKRQQANNRAVTQFLTLDGITRPLAEWARLKGVDRRTLAKRIARGWSHEEAIRGRRLEDERETAPAALRASPTDDLGLPPLPSLGDDGWPIGSTIAMWETSYAGFIAANFGGRPPTGLNRAVFFAWVAGNALAACHRERARLFPETVDTERDPDEPDPIGLAEHHTTQTIARVGPWVYAAQLQVFSDPVAQETLWSLRNKWPKLYDPRTIPRLARYENDD